MNRMVYPRQKYCNSFVDLATDMEKMMGQLFGEDRCCRSTGGAFVPRLDFVESDASFEVVVDLPGVTDEHLNIEVEDNVLTLSGSRKAKVDRDGATYLSAERFSGEFRRSIKIPETVQQDKIEAQFEHGVLTVQLPKREKAKPTKIQIKSS